MSLIIFTPSFVFLAAAVGVAVDHYFIHRKKNDHAQQESCAACCYLQPSDMANHEIWVIAFLSISITWAIATYFFSKSECSYF